MLLRYIIFLCFFFFEFQSFGFSNDGIVIKDEFGIEQTRCSGFSCEPTVSGIMNGYSPFDQYNGSRIIPRIDHVDGSETECNGIFCERSDNSPFGF